MFYGNTGNILKVDLSKGNIERIEADSQIYKSYLGGRGISTKMFWDEVKFEVSPFSENNLLIFGAGLLCGTSAPGANKTVLVTKSPQTNLLSYSNVGGFWATELKHAGYDSLIISGKSDKPVFIWINDQNVQIRSAQHLWGKDTRETQDLLRKELNNDKAQIFSIGQAGENKVYCASIEHSTGASLSRGGVGAVMGDKNIKAIAVEGTKDINIAKPQEFYELSKKINIKSKKLREFVDNWSYERKGLVEYMLYGNFEEYRIMEDTGGIHKRFLEEYGHRQISCSNCTLRCKWSIHLPDGEYSFPKCISWFAFMSASKIQDYRFCLECYRLCEKYGFDSISLSRLIAFAIDLYEKGILTTKDTGGIHLKYGNPDLFFTLIRQIANREGIGDILAKGIYEAAQEIGKGAEDYAWHIKKLEIPHYSPQRPYAALLTSVSERADDFKMEAVVPQHYFKKPKKEKEEYASSKYWPYPEEFKKYLWDDFDVTDYQRHIEMASWDADSNSLSDITGLCIFWTGFWPFNPYLASDQIKLIHYASGIDLDEEEGMRIARRVDVLTRAYNSILGISRKDETVPEICFKAPGKPPASYPPLDRKKFNEMLDNYYRLRGYNKNGIPSERTLKDLDLGYVYEEFIKRGVLASEKNTNHKD